MVDKARLWTDQAMIGAGFSGRWNELPCSYRMPRPLLDLAAQFARTFLPAEGLIAPASPQGELATEPCHLRSVQVASEAVPQACVDEALRLITAKAGAVIAVSDLTVLVDRIDVGVDIVNILNGQGIRTAETFVLANEAGRSAGGEAEEARFLEGQSPGEGDDVPQLQGMGGTDVDRRLDPRKSSKGPRSDLLRLDASQAASCRQLHDGRLLLGKSR